MSDNGGDQLSGFRDKLDACHQWPCDYTFTFIAPAEVAQTVHGLLEKALDQADISTRPSRTGKYISFTAQAHMPDPDAVIAVYKTAASIKGIIAL